MQHQCAFIPLAEPPTLKGLLPFQFPRQPYPPPPPKTRRSPVGFTSMAIIDNFLQEIYKFLKTQNSVQLANYLRVEPEGLSDVFKALCKELKDSYHNDKGIERKVETHIPQDDDDDGGVSASFHAFMQTWLRYWRDVDFSDLVETHSQLTQLTKYVLLPTFQLPIITNFKHMHTGLFAQSWSCLPGHNHPNLRCIS